MDNRETAVIIKTVNFIEQHLSSNAAGYSQAGLDLGSVAAAVGYSKFHLHRMFALNTGLTLHNYVLRRRLTEAARLLIFAGQPLIEIAMRCGYNSQQAFSLSFKAMYKLSPAAYRATCEFYPLQLPLYWQPKVEAMPIHFQNIRWAQPEDIPAWLDLARQSVAGYPHWHEDEYCRCLHAAISRQKALVIPASPNGGLAGALAFADDGCIDFLAVQPQYRRRGLAKLLIRKLCQDIFPHQEIFTTTFRANDCADNGQRAAIQRLGFVAKEPLVEFGYPTQRFVLANN